MYAAVGLQFADLACKLLHVDDSVPVGVQHIKVLAGLSEASCQLRLKQTQHKSKRLERISLLLDANGKTDTCVVAVDSVIAGVFDI